MAEITTFSDLNERQAFVSNFPLNLTQSQAEEYFNQLCGGAVNDVYFRRDYCRQFKGSVYVEFCSKDSMEKFVNSDDMLIFDDHILEKKTKLDFLEEKKERKIENKKRKIMKRQEENAWKKEQERQNTIRQMTHGAVLHLTNIRLCTRENVNYYSNITEDTEPTIFSIKQYFSGLAKVAWVDYDPFEIQAYVRFEEGEKAWEVFEQLRAHKGSVLFNNCLADLDVLQDEKEIDYWSKLLKEIRQREMKKRAKQLKKEKRRQRTCLQNSKR